MNRCVFLYICGCLNVYMCFNVCARQRLYMWAFMCVLTERSAARQCCMTSERSSFSHVFYLKGKELGLSAFDI